MFTKKPYPQGTFYHVFNKSISNYGIFKDLGNSRRFIQGLGYYNQPKPKTNLAKFLLKNKNYSPDLLMPKNNFFVKFIAFCIMPDHYHLLLKILKNNLLSKYIGVVENSFSRFFNTSYKRKGPIWESRFKAVLIENNEQLLHTTRYIHLNPTTKSLVEKPEDWIFSSYKTLITKPQYLNNLITEYSINNPLTYKKFVEDRIDYQKKLHLIKKQILE